MPTMPLLPLPQGLEITSISEAPEEVPVQVNSHRPTSSCPCCATPSSAIHSYYRREPLDLPCRGRPIRLLLTVKKYFCRVPDCPRKIFVERLPGLIAVSSRLTLRLRTAVQEISLATCGKGGERLAGKLGMPSPMPRCCGRSTWFPLPSAPTPHAPPRSCASRTPSQVVPLPHIPPQIGRLALWMGLLMIQARREIAAA